MAELHTTKDDKLFLVIGTNGNGVTGLLQDVPEGTVGAVKREWTVAGKSGVKWEILHPGIDGHITSINFVENKEYGDKINIVFDNEITVSTGVSSRFGSAILRRLPSLDLSKIVRLKTYSFTPKGEKEEKRVITLYQGNEFENKIEDFFYNWETKESKHGIPESNLDWETAQQWEKDKFWADQEAFLKNYIIENVITRIVSSVPEVPEQPLDNTDEDINPEDIPF